MQKFESRNAHFEHIPWLRAFDMDGACQRVRSRTTVCYGVLDPWALRRTGADHGGSRTHTGPFQPAAHQDMHRADETRPGAAVSSLRFCMGFAWAAERTWLVSY